MAERATDDDLDLLDELGVDTAPTSNGGRTAREQRIIAGFEEIERFVAEHGRRPEHGAGRDIFERLYAVRLDRIRESNECREILKDLDSRGLLGEGTNPADEVATDGDLDDEDLLDALGVEGSPQGDVAQLIHVRSRDQIRVAEEVAQRTPCPDFAHFQSLFETVRRDLQSGQRETRKYQDYANVRQGDLFILDGQKVVVAEVGQRFVGEHGRPDCRLRVVFDNGTESDLLLRSLQRALNKDKSSRRITDARLSGLFADVEEPDEDAAPLFSDDEEEGDLATGYIYVLRSKSDHPFVLEHQNCMHKIGVTGGDVEVRVANARKDPTYLLADVEIVAIFKLANVNRKALEALHKFFASARLDLQLKDRFGSQVEPREWFLVPLAVIDEAIQKIKDGTIGGFRFDPQTASLTQI